MEVSKVHKTPSISNERSLTFSYNVGGIEGVASKFNLGGGGGGGVQFFEHFSAQSFGRTNNSTGDSENSAHMEKGKEPKWTSIGGGGGCGTCDVEHDEASGSSDNSTYSITRAYRRAIESNQTRDICSTSESGIICGESADYDSISRTANSTAIAARFRHFLHTVSGACSVLDLAGGGGGGGGTGQCASPFGYGYGFSFQFTSRQPEQLNEPRNSTEDRSSNLTTYSDVTEVGDSQESPINERKRDLRGISLQTGQEEQYKYDIAGALLKDASVMCGGYDDWCCVQGHAAETLTKCLEEAGVEGDGGSEGGVGGGYWSVSGREMSDQDPNGNPTQNPSKDEKPYDNPYKNQYQKQYENGGPGAGDQVRANVSCASVVAAQNRLSWLQHAGSGCDGNSTSPESAQDAADKRDSQDGSADSRDGSSSHNLSYPFSWDHENTPYYAGGYAYTYEKLSRLQSCTSQEWTCNGSDANAASRWATYSADLSFSDLYGPNNSYVLTDLQYMKYQNYTRNGKFTDGECRVSSNDQILYGNISYIYGHSPDPGTTTRVVQKSLHPPHVDMRNGQPLGDKLAHTNIMLTMFISLILLNIFSFFVRCAAK